MKTTSITKILIQTHLLVVTISEVIKTEKHEIHKGKCIYNPNLLN